jgi:PIN domain nuclease of toxin-antitoxin system
LAVLLDTHTFLWWCEDSPELSQKALKAIQGNDCLVSMATFWEISIKVSLNKLRLPKAIERYLPEQMSLNGFETLQIGFRHIVGTATLRWRHRDPFDRLLAAQAAEEEVAIISRDTAFDTYGIKRIW